MCKPADKINLQNPPKRFNRHNPVMDHAPVLFYQQIAWVDCLCWALGEKSCIEKFKAETGISFMLPPRNAIEAMIDEATGVNDVIVERFMLWFNENIYGPIDGGYRIKRRLYGDK